jgi:hypothetical protein
LLRVKQQIHKGFIEQCLHVLCGPVVSYFHAVFPVVVVLMLG